MKGNILIYRLPKNTEQRLVNQFCKKLYGQETSSHAGTYHYRRKGLLDSTPHRKLTRGVIIVEEKNTTTILKFLKEYNAEIHVREVALTPDDKKALKKKS